MTLKPCLPANEIIAVDPDRPVEMGQEDVVEEIETTTVDNMDSRVYSIKSEKGAAFWNKEATGLNGHFVLHRYAARNNLDRSHQPHVWQYGAGKSDRKYSEYRIPQ